MREFQGSVGWGYLGSKIGKVFDMVDCWLSLFQVRTNTTKIFGFVSVIVVKKQ